MTEIVRGEKTRSRERDGDGEGALASRHFFFFSKYDEGEYQL